MGSVSGTTTGKLHALMAMLALKPLDCMAWVCFLAYPCEPMVHDEGVLVPGNALVLDDGQTSETKHPVGSTHVQGDEKHTRDQPTFGTGPG